MIFAFLIFDENVVLLFKLFPPFLFFEALTTLSIMTSAVGARAVMKHLQEISANPIEGVTLRPSEQLHVIEADIQGPADTPFEGGTFHVALTVGDQYPQQPPKGQFRTRIFHPNVAEKDGDICVSTLKKDWDASLGLRHVLVVIKCLLMNPNPESALNAEAGRLLLEQYDSYYKTARMMTSVYAGGPPVMAQPGALRESNTNQAESTSGTSSAPGAENVGGGGGIGSADAKATVAAKKVIAEKKRTALKRL